MPRKQLLNAIQHDVAGWQSITLHGNDCLVDGEPNEEKTKAAALSYSALSPAIINIEHWPLPVSIDKYIAVVDWWHEARPDCRVGYYAMIPRHDYWSPVLGGKYEEEWNQANASLGRTRNANGKYNSRGLADVVDFVCPSLYTFYANGDGGEMHEDYWFDKYAPKNIEAARRYQKQVYPFLWARYHPSNAARAMQYIGDDFLRRQIEFCLEHADGVVVWDWNSPSWPNHTEIIQKTSAVMSTITWNT